MTTPLHDTALAQLFTDAHTHTSWLEKSIPQELLTQLYDLVKVGSTSANCSPARFVFITSEEAKEKLKRQGVWVKGYGYAPVGGEPIDVINAIRDKLNSSTMGVKNFKGMKAVYVSDAVLGPQAIAYTMRIMATRCEPGPDRMCFLKQMRAAEEDAAAG